MSSSTVGSLGEIALSDDVRKRYGLTPNTPIRIVETRTGILIVPLTDEPMSVELARELEEWRTVGSNA